MMKHIAAALALACLAPTSFAQTPETARAVQGETIIAKVNGMVCDFCAQAVMKMFGKEEAVADVRIDLNDGSISIDTKPGASLADARVEELVRKSGYALVAIERPSA